MSEHIGPDFSLPFGEGKQREDSPRKLVSFSDALARARELTASQKKAEDLAIPPAKEDDLGFGALDQAAIDALFAGSPLPPKPLDPGSAPAEDDFVPGSLDQAAIDKLFAQRGDASASPATTSHPNPVAEPGADPYALDQAAIDALFAERPPYHRVGTGEVSVAAPDPALPVADHEARSLETEKLLYEARDFAFTLNNLSGEKTFHLSHQQRGDQVYGDADPDFINFLKEVNSKRDKYRINFNIPNQFHIPVGGEMVITEVHAAVGFDLDESGRPVIDIEAETEISESELLLKRGFDRILTVGECSIAEMRTRLEKACREYEYRVTLRLSDGSLWGVDLPNDEFLSALPYDNPGQKRLVFFSYTDLVNGIREDKTLRGTDVYVNDGSEFEPTERGYFLTYPNRMGIGLEFGPEHTYAFKHDNEDTTGYFVYVNPVVSGATLVPSTQVSVFFKPANGNRIIEKMTVRELMNGLNQPENFIHPAEASETIRQPEPPVDPEATAPPPKMVDFATALKRARTAGEENRGEQGSESDIEATKNEEIDNQGTGLGTEGEEAENINIVLDEMFEPVSDLVAMLQRGTSVEELKNQPLTTVDRILFRSDYDAVFDSMNRPDIDSVRFRTAFVDRQEHFRDLLKTNGFEQIIVGNGQVFDRSRIDVLPSRSELPVMTTDPLSVGLIAGVTPGEGGYKYKGALVRPAFVREYIYQKPDEPPSPQSALTDEEATRRRLDELDAEVRADAGKQVPKIESNKPTKEIERLENGSYVFDYGKGKKIKAEVDTAGLKQTYRMKGVPGTVYFSGLTLLKPDADPSDPKTAIRVTYSIASAEEEILRSKTMTLSDLKSSLDDKLNYDLHPAD